MQDNLRNGTRRIWRGGGKNGLAIEIAAAIENSKHSSKNEHGGNRQHQNTVAKGRLSLRSCGSSIVVAKRATLSESRAREKQCAGETNACR